MDILPAKEVISVRVEYDLKAALDQIAGATESKRGDVMHTALVEYVRNYPRNSAPAPLTPADRQEHAALRAAVRNLMIDGQWRTKTEMADALDVPHCAIEGMLRRWRELSEVKHGGYILDKEQIAPKVWKYRIVMPKVSWKVTANHPILARPDRFGLSEPDARAYANSLRPLGYENINVTIDVIR